MSKNVFGQVEEQTAIKAKDEYGNPVTIIRSIINRGHQGICQSASATRDKDGAKLIHAEGNDALKRVLAALGMTFIGMIVLAAIGGIIFILVNSPGLI